MSAQARPLIKAAGDAGGAATAAYGAGHSLEAVLTRGSPSAVFSELSPEFPARSGVLAFERFELLHDHAHGSPSRAEPQAPPAPVSPQARRSFAYYAAGVSAVKVGIETLNLAVPLLVLSQVGTAVTLGALFVSAQVSGLVSGALSGTLIDRFGPARVLAGTAFAQAAVVASIPAAVLLGLPVGAPFLFGVFVANGAFAGVFDIARRAALPGIVGSDEGTLRRFNAKLYIARETAAIAAVFAAGGLLHHIGALATVSLHPGAYVVAAAALFLLARRGRAERPGPMIPPGEPAGPSGWREFLLGARLVWADPALRLAAAVNMPVIALHNFFHAMLAVVYATAVLGQPALAAVLIGAWNAGELAAAFKLSRRSEVPGSGAWLRYAALTGLLGWALWAFPTIWVAAPAVFLLATGTLSGELGLASFFQAAAPRGRLGAVTAFVYSLATAAAMLAVLAAGAAFDAFGVPAALLLVAVALSAASAFYLFASGRLAAAAARKDD